MIQVRKVAGRIKRMVLGIPPQPHLPGALTRVRSLGVQFNSAFDVGASDGQWTRAARQIYPDACYVMVEAQPRHQEKLSAYAGTSSNLKTVFGAAGDEDGEISFVYAESDPFAGAATRDATDQTTMKVPCFRLDSVAKKESLTPPFLVKLDTHGFEIPILEGAASVLEQTSVAIIEAYNFKLMDNAVRFHELCAYMEERGFRCFDIIDVMRRRKDGALWQFDMVFLKSDLAIFQDNNYA